MSAQDYEMVVGLEVHAQLTTKTKLFCSDATHFGESPNTQVSVVSLAHPGTLPVMNRGAIDLALRLGLALNCDIVRHNYFARKNYFYPDLPKGYQISQHTAPICQNGYVEINVDGKEKKVRLNRIHMEEDAGKSVHDASEQYTGIDLNRAGIPLLEIVTEPDLGSSAEAYAYVSELRSILRYLNVCDGNMEQGRLRCDVNISVRKKGDPKLGTKVEIKNLNSIRFIRKAIEVEKERLIALVESGGTVLQQTRGYDEVTNTTYAIRTKEDADDYRYFADPDLPPFHITDEMIEAVRSAMPPSRKQRVEALQQEFGLSDYDTNALAADTGLEALFRGIAQHTSNTKAAANWVLNPIRNKMVEAELSSDELAIAPEAIATLIRYIDEKKTTHGIAVQKVLPALFEDGKMDVAQYLESNNLLLSDNSSELDGWIQTVLDKYPQKVTEFKKGKKGLIGFFVGEAMRMARGKADAQAITDKFTEKLKG
ncbi:aspartyl/glutamyl-tRNA(Asn/Gln) amidotransferase subunit B [Cnuella takakiae]|uniref:Aspartyl/glutamyl-tRNA(Asn/Gln) amidotransferase subunit B n=1 Tax=Cnuella takakiae TaxID=1302690 RepID=A0A1M5EV42_9BACT|nr:Asp-tRNA(Asn)/Glu-tRNA(Gln) amidotransferase subunit GatB [Cnuella takakiae]OLY91312.1 glutaminyl-tRNA synthase (glutamine-hydrolyzing) subunit B [Cnuella takakiae]SHF83077.1 aspartyl/glutamyl-tRNA(Asn/Gln) amidotransferase subunit B [Cnuella takakiae]